MIGPRSASRLPGVLRRCAWVGLAAWACVSLGCSPAGSRARPVEVTVFAAASLREVFDRIAGEFEAGHPGARVTLNYAGSSALAVQIQQGAAADVVALADWANLQPLVDDSLVRDARDFARNRLVVVLPAANPRRVTSLADLARPGLRLALAAPEVPAGHYARQVLEKLEAHRPGYRDAVLANVATEEPNVRQVLLKVELGEADAAFVYATDALAAGVRVRTLPIPAEDNVTARYPLALGKRLNQDAKTAALAADFVAQVASPAGKRALADAGFLVDGE